MLSLGVGERGGGGGDGVRRTSGCRGTWCGSGQPGGGGGGGGEDEDVGMKDGPFLG